MASKTRKRKSKRKPISAKRRVAEHKTGFASKAIRTPDGMQRFKLKAEGIKRLDIMPYTVGDAIERFQHTYAEAGDGYYERTFFIHRNIGADKDSYICPAKTFGKPCPICEHRASLMQDGDADEELIRSLSPSQRQLWYVVDLADKDKGVQLWDMSFHNFGKQLDKEIQNADEDEPYDMFADPEEGYTLKLGVDEESIGRTTFYSVGTVGFKPRKAAIDEDLYEDLEPLEDLVLEVEYDDLKAIFLQVEDSSDEDDDDGDKDKPAKKKKSEKSTSKKSSKKKPEPEEEDEEDWDEEDQEESEQEESDDDTDDEDWDDEEEEESDDEEEESDDSDDDEDWDDDEDDEDDSDSDSSQDDEDDDDDDWDDDEDDEPAPPPKKKKSTTKKKSTAKKGAKKKSTKKKGTRKK